MVAQASIADRRLLMYTTLLSAAIHLWLGVAVLRDEAWVQRLFGGHALATALESAREINTDTPVEIDTVVELPPEPEPPEPVVEPEVRPPLRLGIQDSDADTKTWLGFAEAEEHLVPIASPVEQAALTPNDVGGMASGLPDARGVEPAPAPDVTPEVAAALVPPSPAMPPPDPRPPQPSESERPIEDPEPDAQAPTAIAPKTDAPIGAPAPKPEGPETEGQKGEPQTPLAPADRVEPEARAAEPSENPPTTPPEEEASPKRSEADRPAEEADAITPPPEDAEPSEVLGPLPVPTALPAPPPATVKPTESSPAKPIESATEGAPAPDIIERDGSPAEIEKTPELKEGDHTSEAETPEAPMMPPGVQPPGVVVASPTPEPPPGPAPGPTTGSGNSPGVGEGEALRRGVRSDKESPAASLKRAVKYRPGRPLAVQGLEVRTVEPRFPVSVRLTASPKNPIVVIHFDRRGVVVRAEFLKDEEKKIIYSTGTGVMDEPLLTAIYQWRAKGRELEELPADDPEATVSFVMEIYLRR